MLRINRYLASSSSANRSATSNYSQLSKTAEVSRFAALLARPPKRCACRRALGFIFTCAPRRSRRRIRNHVNPRQRRVSTCTATSWWIVGVSFHRSRFACEHFSWRRQRLANDVPTKLTGDPPSEYNFHRSFAASRNLTLA